MKKSKRQRRKGKIYPVECRVPEARRDKKAFLNEQCKEIKRNNRMTKTRHLFKKIGDIKGTFPVLVSPVLSKRPLVFPILLVSSISLHCSFKKALSFLAILWNSAFSWVYLSLSPLPFASLLFSAICKASSDQAQFNHSDKYYPL